MTLRVQIIKFHNKTDYKVIQQFSGNNHIIQIKHKFNELRKPGSTNNTKTKL